MTGLPPDTLLERASAAWEGGHHELALKLFQQDADAGTVGSMLNLGYFLDRGIGCEPDQALAMRWYKRAYRHGDPAGASNVAVLYEAQGKHRLAFAWHARAANAGDGDSSLELAKRYLAGRGVRRSVASARARLRQTLSSNLVTPASLEEAAATLRCLDA